MPAIMVVFIALFGAAHTDSLLRGDSAAWKLPDHNAKSHTSKTPVAYVLTTSPWHSRRADMEGGCDFSILARVQGHTPMRLNLGGKEQLLGTSWAFKTRIKGGERVSMEAWFIEPQGGDTAAYRRVSFTCRAYDLMPVYVQPDMSGVR